MTFTRQHSTASVRIASVSIASLLAIALSGCGGDSSEADDTQLPPTVPPAVTPVDNSAPVANAGIDQTVMSAVVVTLDASGSSDADGDTLNYQWTFISLPDGSVAALNGASSANPSFSADIDGSYVIALTVSDGTDSSVDTVTVTAAATDTNNTPVANAGVDRGVTTGSSITLDGSASSDVDGDALTYSWTLDSVQVGSSASLNSAGTVSPEFTADTDGDYQVSLVVSDGSETSLADSVTISSTSSGTTPVSRSYAIVDTNQNQCYDSTSGGATSCIGNGYDADYSGNQPSYTLSDDGLIVTDNITGLIWQQSSDINGDGSLTSDDKLYQSDTVSYCENLTYGGRNDWRLPSIKESYSLIQFSGKDPSGYQGTDTSALTPFIDEIFDWAFGDLASGERIIDGQFASSTQYVSTTMNADATTFGVNFVDGRIKGYPSERLPFYVRCVSGNTDYGVNAFSDNGDLTVNDDATGLMWQQDDSDSVNWEDAVAQCEAATTASHTDWRLPDAKELQSIVDYSRSPDTHNQAAIDPIFNASSFNNEAGEDDWGFYWASSTHATYNDNGSSATYVSFGRALGYMNGNIMDVHGAGAQRSNNKTAVSSTPGAGSSTGVNGTFYYHGPQGDILRDNNKVRCVRDSEPSEDVVASEGYTLFSPMQSTDTYLIDQQTNTLHSWQSDYRPGLSVYLMESGELLRPGVINNKPTTFSGQTGGSAGVIEVLDWNSDVIWSTSLATDSYLSHHDVEVLPNGNILAIVWEAKTAEEALALGRTSVFDDTLWADAVYEICRAGEQSSCTDGEIVWRWSIWDHVVQDVDSSITQTYVTDIGEHTDKVDLNFFNGSGSADWTHVNSVDYDSATDQILISVHNFSEYWVIDHSGASQGIVSRVGNPSAHGGDGEQTLFVQHDAQFIESGTPGDGNILVFNNGANRPEGNYSSVDEFCFQGEDCTPGELVNSYSEGVSGEFYADHISGAQRLENGNTLVCEGTEGRLFEYNASHEVVWEYQYGSEIFKATHYRSDYSGLAELNE
ncbi:hypothetical protein Ssed_2588 [Shewanella sediminis HAW-EB3]|uniref:PKD/Chitinase domain-containing protein n=1 Tax=Shewanella sediminis (strain HAW-EB3) TaxID=425104 RepID=A8FWH2_SHESH|nr:DUF1566 domain-containing protein [Shewanella sediminis]ABV37195.1 hypothetical protein Ssed_2588 [Shewanella sediminis HAW-EB3]